MKWLRITLNSFEVFDQKAFCQYLTHMAEKGWMIKHVHMYYLLFERCARQSLTFGIDFETFPNEMMETKKNQARLQEYFDLCGESGWTFAAQMEKGFIFYHAAGAYAEPLCSDEILQFKAYVGKTIFLYISIALLLIGYVWLGRRLFPISSVERIHSFDPLLAINMWIFFLPPLIFRYIRYFAYILHNYDTLYRHGRMWQMSAFVQTLYHRYYRISQSLFLLIGLPFTVLGMLHFGNYSKVLYTLLTCYFLVSIGVGILIDIGMDHIVRLQKHRYILHRIPNMIFLFAFFVFLVSYNARGFTPIRSYANEGVVVPIGEDAYEDGYRELYQSFYLYGGSKTNVYTRQKEDYTFFATSVLYQMKREDLSTSYIKEMMVSIQQEEESYIDLSTLEIKYPEKVSTVEITNQYEPMDVDIWQVDEAYWKDMPNQHKVTYLFRKGADIYVYTFADTVAVKERLSCMQTALLPS